MKSKTADEMIQSAVWLPRSLHERLRKAGGERGLGKEIRRRLEASFETEKAPANPKMVYVLDAITSCADEIANDYGSWSEDPFAFEVLKGCVNLLLTRFQPKGDPVPNAKPGSSAAFVFGADAKPDEVSRTYVHSWISFGMKSDESDNEEKRR